MRYFDTHCDTILKTAENGSLAENAFEVDFRRLAQYDTAVQVFAVFNEGNLLCSDILQYVHMIQTQAESCEIARFADGYGSLVQNAGMVSCMASVEGLGNTPDFVLEQVDALYDAGVRVMSLTWNQDNALCGGIENNQAGLTDMGRAVIQRMNEKKDSSGCIPRFGSGILGYIGLFRTAGGCDPFQCTGSLRASAQSDGCADDSDSRKRRGDRIKPVSGISKRHQPGGCNGYAAASGAYGISGRH